MPYAPEIFKGRSDQFAICRDGFCIHADDPAFDGYSAMKHEDIAMIQNYIIELRSSCKEWYNGDEE